MLRQSKQARGVRASCHLCYIWASGNEKAISWLSLSVLHFYTWPCEGTPLWSLSVLFPHSCHGLRERATRRSWRGNEQRLRGWVMLVCFSLCTVRVWEQFFYVSQCSYLTKPSVITFDQNNNQNWKQPVIRWQLSTHVCFIYLQLYTLMSYNRKTT